MTRAMRRLSRTRLAAVVVQFSKYHFTKHDNNDFLGGRWMLIPVEPRPEISVGSNASRRSRVRPVSGAGKTRSACVGLPSEATGERTATVDQRLRLLICDGGKTPARIGEKAQPGSSIGKLSLKARKRVGPTLLQVCEGLSRGALHVLPGDFVCTLHLLQELTGLLGPRLHLGYGFLVAGTGFRAGVSELSLVILDLRTPHIRLRLQIFGKGLL